jgi:hypothetical protein
MKTQSIRATFALLGALASLAVQAQTVAASPCAAGQKVLAKAAATAASQAAANDAMATLQSQLQQDAMNCVKRAKDAIAAASIHSIDFSSILSQLESQLVAKACSIVMSEVNTGINTVTNPINTTINNGVASINTGINNTLGGATGTTLTGVTVGGGTSIGKPVGTIGLPTSTVPLAAPKTATTSTWDHLSCAFGGSCSN